jgi:choline-sulfatase
LELSARRSGLSSLLLVAIAAGCAEPPSPIAGHNVVLVVVDALSAPHLGSYGSAEPTSPFIDTLARRSVLFEKAVSTASHTVPATISLLASAYPSRHQNQYFSQTRSFRRPESGARPMLSGSLPWMAELFQAAGYRSVAVTANPWIRERYGFARGFEEFHFLPASHPQPRAPLLNAVASEVFRSSGERPFFLYLHYMDVHNPYAPPAPYRERFTAGMHGRNLRSNGPMPGAAPADVAVTRALYDAEIRAFDDQLRGLYEQLVRSGLADSTLLVFTADHGEEFHQHGGLGHGWTLFEESLHVPLFFLHPALRDRAERIRFPVSGVDLLPTLLELVGEPVPEGLDGVSLAPLILRGKRPPEPERLIFSELGDIKAVRRGDRKLISSERRGGTHALGDSAFDLRVDPQEESALADASWPAEMRRALRQLHATTQASVAASTQNEGTPAGEPEAWFEDQLRVLGYIE